MSWTHRCDGCGTELEPGKPWRSIGGIEEPDDDADGTIEIRRDVCPPCYGKVWAFIDAMATSSRARAAAVAHPRRGRRVRHLSTKESQ